MTSKNSERDYAWAQAKELCAEVNLLGDEAEVPVALIAKMHLDPTSVSRVDPPPGYEDRLVASLMARAHTFVVPSDTVRAEVPWYKLASKLIPATVFSFVIIAGFALFQLATRRTHPVVEESDLWAKAVENASEVQVSRWIASVSGGDLQNITTSSDFAILSGELSERQIESVLKDGGGS